MKNSRLVLSDQAAADIIEQSDWYGEHCGRSLDTHWEKAITSTLLRLAKNANSGAQCNFRRQELRHVRRTRIAGFPKHLVFYKFDGTEIFILRVLHGARDLENLF